MSTRTNYCSRIRASRIALTTARAAPASRIGAAIMGLLVTSLVVTGSIAAAPPSVYKGSAQRLIPTATQAGYFPLGSYGRSSNDTWSGKWSRAEVPGKFLFLNQSGSTVAGHYNWNDASGTLSCKVSGATCSGAFNESQFRGTFTLTLKGTKFTGSYYATNKDTGSQFRGPFNGTCVAGPCLQNGAKATTPTTAARPPTKTTTAASPPSPRPRLAGLYVQTYHPNGIQALIVKFKGKLAPCSYAHPAKIKFILNSRSIRYSLGNTWCTEQEGWNEGGDFFWNPNEALSESTLALEPNPGSFFFATHPQYRRTIDFGYWAIIDGKLARKGRLRLDISNSYRTIWEDEDDFINYCIDHSERLYSSGGRLYCLRREMHWSMKVLR